MRHNPAAGTVVIMLRALKMHGMAKAVGELTEQGSPAFEGALPILSQLLKAETADREVRSTAYQLKAARFPSYRDLPPRPAPVAPSWIGKSQGTVAPLSSVGLQTVLDRQVKRIGMIATLRRASGDRLCWMFFGQWSARDLMGGLIDPLDRLAIISPVGLTIPPDSALDRLITWVQPYSESNPVELENLRILQAPERIAPADVVICWKLRVRR